MTKPQTTLKDIARRLKEHLRRLEEHDRGPYYKTTSYVAGRYVAVVYVSYQGPTMLSKADAEGYLQWLDDGNDGKHWAWRKSVESGK